MSATRRFNRVRLLEHGKEVAALPGGVMLSTHPRHAVDARGRHYIIKGDSLETVVAESLGYALAELVGLPTPEWGLASIDGSGHPWFASQVVELRQTEAVLQSGAYSNRGFLSSLVVFDQWIGNADRNVNNVVGRIPMEGERGEAELLAIDFEKAYVLRGESQFMTFARVPKEFLPRHFLRHFLVGDSEIDESMVRRIQELSREQLEMVFGRFHRSEDGMFPPLPIPWAENGIAHLASRARRIAALTREAFDA